MQRLFFATSTTKSPPARPKPRQAWVEQKRADAAKAKQLEGKGAGWADRPLPTIDAALEAELNANKPSSHTRAPIGVPPDLCGFDCSRRGRCFASLARDFFAGKAESSGMEVRSGTLSQPDEMFAAMLSLPASSHCPDSLSGLWWQRDSSIVETLITFSDAAWAPGGKLAIKRQVAAWSIVPSAIGFCNWRNRAGAEATMSVQLSPSGDWILFDGWVEGGKKGGQWAFKVKPGDAITMDADGSPTDICPGDWVRVSFSDPFRPRRDEITWTYLVQRVAWLDEGGGIVRGAAYEGLRRRALMKSVDQCGHRLACCVGGAGRDAMWLAQSDEQAYCLPVEGEAGRDASGGAA